MSIIIVWLLLLWLLNLFTIIPTVIAYRSKRRRLIAALLLLLQKQKIITKPTQLPAAASEEMAKECNLIASSVFFYLSLSFCLSLSPFLHPSVITDIFYCKVKRITPK